LENEINNFFLSILTSSTITILLGIIFYTVWLIPEEIPYKDFVIHWWKLILTLIIGLISGYSICYSTYYYTSKSFDIVTNLAMKTVTSGSANLILGLALGNFSTIIPVLIIAGIEYYKLVTVLISDFLCGINGIAFSSFGVILNLPAIFLFTIFGPLSDTCST